MLLCTTQAHTVLVVILLLHILATTGREQTGSKVPLEVAHGIDRTKEVAHRAAGV